MSIEKQYDKNKLSLKIIFKGDFNYLSFSDFREAYSSDDAKSAENIIIDFKETNKIDSSALGMLLQMQEHLGKNDREIQIINCNEKIKKILEITHFKTKFNIQE